MAEPHAPELVDDSPAAVDSAICVIKEVVQELPGGSVGEELQKGAITAQFLLDFAEVFPYLPRAFLLPFLIAKRFIPESVVRCMVRYHWTAQQHALPKGFALDSTLPLLRPFPSSTPLFQDPSALSGATMVTESGAIGASAAAGGASAAGGAAAQGWGSAAGFSNPTYPSQPPIGAAASPAQSSAPLTSPTDLSSDIASSRPVATPCTSPSSTPPPTSANFLRWTEPSQACAAVFASGAVAAPAGAVDRFGRGVILVKPSAVDTSWPSTALLEALWTCAAALLSNRQVAQRGFCVFCDAEGAGLRNFHRTGLSIALKGVQSCMPVRVGQVVVCNAPRMIGVVLPFVIKLIAEEKVRKRFAIVDVPKKKSEKDAGRNVGAMRESGGGTDGEGVAATGRWELSRWWGDSEGELSEESLKGKGGVGCSDGVVDTPDAVAGYVDAARRVYDTSKGAPTALSFIAPQWVFGTAGGTLGSGPRSCDLAVLVRALRSQPWG